MLNTIIIEDETPALELLVQAITEADCGVQISALLRSAREASYYLSSQPAADLIFSDVQLNDGNSFDLLKESGNRIPVVFVTGYDEYTIRAFSANGIDYLLKPVDREDVRNALTKYHSLQRHFISNFNMNVQGPGPGRSYPSRVVVKRGLDWLTLKLDDVVMIYTENKLVFVLDRDGKKYIIEKNLGEMEKELDPGKFFRANRQHIINLQFIKRFRSFEKVKLTIELNLPELKNDIIVSQENASNFRRWIFNA